MSTNQTRVPTAQDMLWMAIGGSPSGMVFWCGISAVGTAVLLTRIWSHTAIYLDHFRSKDHPLAVGGIVAGTLIFTGYLILICVQVYRLSHHAYTDYASVAHFDNLCITLLAFVGSFFTLVACIFYSWRVYNLWGKKKCFIAPLAIVIVTPFLWSFPLIKRSGEMPDITLEAFTDGSFAAWGKDMQMFWEVWQALTFGGCIVVGGLLLTVLNKPRTSLFSVEKRVYRRLTSLVMEAMLPPVVLLIIVEGANALPGSPYSDWRRAVFAVISPLYFLSVLHSLVARIDIRQILNKELSEHGISISSGSSQGTGRKVFVSHQSDVRRASGTENKEWVAAEEG